MAQLNSNIGNHNRTKIGFIPQLRTEVGYQLTEHLRTYAGYEIIYWDKVLRAAEQIDPMVDSGNIPGSAVTPTTDRPEFNYREASYWAHGLRVGAELRY